MPVFLLAMVLPRIPAVDAGLRTRVWAFSVGDWLRWAFTTPVEYGIGWRFHRGAWRSLRHGRANMDVLIVLGTNAAYWYSVGSLVYAAVRPSFHASDFFETAAMLITFILLGKYLEVLAKGERATSNWSNLSRIYGQEHDPTVQHSVKSASLWCSILGFLTQASISASGRKFLVLLHHFGASHLWSTGTGFFPKFVQAFVQLRTIRMSEVKM